jgi:ectoine hydroxylase-related dioxygenase (phytanoyl-CoA dioxygenase family)
MLISDDDRNSLREDGYVLVRELLTRQEVAACREEIGEHFPTCDQRLADPDRYANTPMAAFFPYAGPTLNHVSVHPAVIDLVARVLGTDELRIGDAVAQAKYGRLAGPTRDQRLHNDAWEGASLVHPLESGIFQRVFAIVYLTDVTEHLAPTYVVPRSACENAALVTEAGLASYVREDYPELYEAERPVEAPAGSALITLGRTIHRGSAMRADRGERFALFTNYHAAAATWQRSRTFVSLPGAPEGPAASQFMASATPQQRQLFGFPPPGHAYWNPTTTRQIAELYPGMDLAPYTRIAAVAGADGARTAVPAAAATRGPRPPTRQGARVPARDG